MPKKGKFAIPRLKRCWLSDNFTVISPRASTSRHRHYNVYILPRLRWRSALSSTLDSMNERPSRLLSLRLHTRARATLLYIVYTYIYMYHALCTGIYTH